MKQSFDEWEHKIKYRNLRDYNSETNDILNDWKEERELLLNHINRLITQYHLPEFPVCNVITFNVMKDNKPNENLKAPDLELRTLEY